MTLLDRLGLRRVTRRAPLGPWGERVASRVLRRKGYRVIDRNVRTKLGEIDLLCIAPDRRTLVVVEVKTRLLPRDPGVRTPRPEDALTHAKRARLARLAQLEAKRRSMESSPVRIDVVAIERPRTGKPVVRHHENAVTP